MKVDVIIPVYKPDGTFLQLLDKLQTQTVPVHRIILMNTEKQYFDRLLLHKDIGKVYTNVSVTHLSKQEFDHGKTRSEGVQQSGADVVMMMTQDAMPADNRLVERLLTALQQDETIAVAYARQLPAKDCSMVERYTRKFNYPKESMVKSKEDLPRLGIKTYFCSNVCAAYRRDIYDRLGGFLTHTIFNEDMIYAAGAINSGYKVAYAADALVIHSHNYTNGQQLKRNFDLGVSQADHPDIFKDVPSESEGMKMVTQTISYLWHKGQAWRIPGFIIQTACKYTGYLLGKQYQKLPRNLIEKLTMNQEYWK